jgi:hypothetical protein
MARPLKRTCDYFPHFARHDRSLYPLESQFGTEGYYFFYCLMEFLCLEDDITYKVYTKSDLNYFYQHFALEKDKVDQMLKVCSDNGIIDSELWSKAKIIWMAELSNKLADAWEGRKDGAPSKPILGYEVNERNVSEDEIPY